MAQKYFNAWMLGMIVTNAKSHLGNTSRLSHCDCVPFPQAWHVFHPEEKRETARVRLVQGLGCEEDTKTSAHSYCMEYREHMLFAYEWHDFL